MWWLTPVIPALWEAEADRSLRSGVRDHPGQHGETASLSANNTKIIRAWWHVPIVPATQEAQAGESLQPQATRGCRALRLWHCTPAWVTG